MTTKVNCIFINDLFKCSFKCIHIFSVSRIFDFLVFMLLSQVLSQGKEVVLQSQVSGGATLINDEITFETCTR